MRWLPARAFSPVSVFLFFVAFVQFAILNILTGIFVENAMKLAQPDRDAIALEHRKEQITTAEELRQVFEGFGGRKPGVLTKQEFTEQMRRGKLIAHLSTLGLDVRDATLFFGVLAASSDTQEVDINAFVDGCMRLRGSATSIDMQGLVFQTRLIHKCQRRLHKELMDNVTALAHLNRSLALARVRPDSPGDQHVQADRGCQLHQMTL